jgi:hypothetical protein
MQHRGASRGDERTVPDPSGPGRQGLFTRGRRRLAWVGFFVLAAYTPVISWLTGDDTYLMPLTVAGMVGYAIVVDDHLRRTRTTRSRPVDDPGSVDNLDQRDR